MQRSVGSLAVFNFFFGVRRRGQGDKVQSDSRKSKESQGWGQCRLK